LTRTITPLVAILLAGACDDPTIPTAPTEDTAPLPQVIACRAEVAAGTVLCQGLQSDPVPGLSLSVIVGNPHVRLASDNVSYDGSAVFQADVTVQNLIGQALGTTDGTTLDPEGVRVFFHEGPSVTGGDGIVTVANASGTATFILTEQPYFQYDEMLDTDDISSPMMWRWNVPSSVLTFNFAVYVWANVQYDDGWVDVSPEQPVVGIGLTETLDAVVRDRIGRPVTGRTVTWSSLVPGVADVDPGTGEVSGVAEGTSTVCASSSGPEADGCVTVTVKPVVYVRTLAAPVSPSVGGTSDIALQLDVTQISEPLTSMVGDVTWTGSLLDYLDDAAGTIWDLLFSNETPAGTLKFSAISAAGLTGDVLDALTFSVQGLSEGCSDFTPTLTELTAIDPVTFESINLLERAIIITEPVNVCVVTP
ncbi:MAG: Ig-like domain-containing protein, partial [Gemmatimonadota bacterium]|nr:Ig-like domain-containing protein [Gemmatimonadota bacterium]